MAQQGWLESQHNNAWEESGPGNLHPDRSYFKRPVDPEIVARVRCSLAKYKGPKSFAENDMMIRKQAEQRQRKMKADTEQYYVWLQKQPEDMNKRGFIMAENPQKGRPSSAQYIREKVKHGLRDMREKDKDYKAWVEDRREKHSEELREKLKEKQMADAAFEQDAEEQTLLRAERDADIQAEVAQVSTKYWSWLRDMKKEVASRPSSAPPARKSEVESAATMAKKKQQESITALHARRKEYSSWLQSVSEPKFKMPYYEVSSDELERRAAYAKKMAVDDHRVRAEYSDFVQRMERKHHMRVMRALKEKLVADKQFNEDQEAAGKERNAQGEQKKQQQREIALNYRQEVSDIYSRIKAKPLFIENAYNKSQ